MAKKKIDFSGVETFQRAPEGTHTARVAEMKEVTFQSGNEGFKVAFEITKGPGKGAKVYDNFPLSENSLWKLKSLLEAVKIKCDGRILLDTDKVVGRSLEIDVYHEEYEGQMRARLGEMRRIGESRAEEPEDEEDDLEEEFDEDEEDEEEEEPKKPQKKSVSKTKKKFEVEEDEAPAKKATAKTASKKTKVEEPEDDSEDWDDEEDWED